jgi:hypothetical protein
MSQPPAEGAAEAGAGDLAFSTSSDTAAVAAPIACMYLCV